jgi:very-short-patch-repair endonuclease
VYLVAGDGAEIHVTPPWVDEAIVALARHQHGAVSTRQLLDAGVGPHAIDARVARGWLRRLHRGVYAVGALESELTAPAGAILATGGRAVLSHRTAATVWGIVPARPEDPVEITLLDARSKGRRGVLVHTGRLATKDIRTRHGMQLTSPTRTLRDLAQTAPDELDEALNEAQIRRLVTAKDLQRLLTLPQCGVRALRKAIDDSPGLTRSEAELKLLALVRSAGLPMPRANAKVAGHEVDLHWPDHNLVVEFDSWTYHSTRAAFERDRRRDVDLQLAGQRVLRVTDRHLTREPLALVARFAAALATPGQAPRPLVN